MLGSARRASGGFPSPRELNFHFCSRPKKGSKMRAKMEPFGLQNLNYTRFGAPFGRNWGPKTEKKKGHEKCSKKVTRETQGCARVLRFGWGVPYKDPEIRPSERGKPYGHSSCALRAPWRIYIYIYISDVPCRVSAVRVGACYVVSAAVRVEAPRVRVGIWQCVLILHGRVLGFGSAC